MNALDFDHADIFSDLNAIKTMFKRLLNLVPGRGKVFYWKGSKNLVEITKEYKHAPVESFDLGDKNSIFKYEKGVLSEIRTKAKLKPSLIGSHNYRNVEVAVRICLEIAPQKKKRNFRSSRIFPRCETETRKSFCLGF